MLTSQRHFGTCGEQLAAAFLVARGFRILERQARVPRTGEIDLVALEGRELAFIEVKTRSTLRFGSPEDAVTPAKLQTLSACAESWRMRHGWTARPYRLDVIAIEFRGTRPIIRHLRHVGS